MGKGDHVGDCIPEEAWWPPLRSWVGEEADEDQTTCGGESPPLELGDQAPGSVTPLPCDLGAVTFSAPKSETEALFTGKGHSCGDLLVSMVTLSQRHLFLKGTPDPRVRIRGAILLICKSRRCMKIKF